MGTAGTLQFHDDTLRILGEDPAVVRFDTQAGYQESFDRTIGHFAARIRDGGEFETAPADNLQTLALVESVYELAGQAGA